jgi:cytochrome c peroxidase
MKTSRFILISLFFISCIKNSNKNVSHKNSLFLLSIINSTTENYYWNLPAGFPIPVVPKENPMSNSKVELGRFLFYEKKLSGNQTQSCGSCHIQDLAFAEGFAKSQGSTGDFHPRNSQVLANSAYSTRLTWMNSNISTLEQQVRLPLFGTTPIELGLADIPFESRLKSDPKYIELFSKAFPKDFEPISEQNVRFALSSFMRSIISGNSKFDQFQNGNYQVLSASEIRGKDLFFSDITNCSKCHSGFNFSDSTTSQDSVQKYAIYHDNGHRSKSQYLSLKENETGLYELTQKDSDIGKFRTPSLRNIARSYPYMHDGFFGCDDQFKGVINKYNNECAENALSKVVEHYMSGGNNQSNKDSQLIRSFSLTPTQKQDLIQFLFTLTDEEMLSNPSFSNPH